MRVLIDADGCPVVRETVRQGAAFHVPCLLCCDTAHVFSIPGVEVFVAQALHPVGHAYTKDNIDALLTVRAESARLRRGGVRLHRTAARKPAQDHAFSVLLCRILSENTGT